MTTPSFKYRGVTTTYKPRYGGYTGYRYEEELTVQKLLGKDPALADKNEVVQSSGLGARSATVEIYCSSAERDILETFLWHPVIHDDGIDGPRPSTVMAVQSELYHKTASQAAVFKVMVKLRERGSLPFVPPVGILAWYKADDLTGADASTVTLWPDKGGNALDAVPGVAPKLAKDFIAKGLHAVYADTLGQYLKTSVRVGNSLGTAFSVSAAPTNGASAPSIAYDQGGKKRIITYYDTNTKLFNGNSDDVLDQDSEGDLKRWVDGVATGAGNYDIANTNLHVISEQSFDAAADTMNGTETRLLFGSASFLGKVAEIMLFSTVLSTADRQLVEKYLRDKYGL